MALQAQPFVVNDFTGGITDYPLDAQPNQAYELNNFLINPNKKLESIPGFSFYDSDFPQVPDGLVRIAGLFAATSPELLVYSGKKVWRPNTTVFSEFTGPSGNPVFNAGTSASSYASFAEYNDHIYAVNSEYSYVSKIFKNSSNVWQVRTAGLPAVASTPTVTSSGGSGNNYIYAFAYSYTYNTNNAEFRDDGPVITVSLNNIGAPNVNNVNVTGIPVITNGSTFNYDTSNVKVFIYRTINNGLILYKVGEVTNGTTTFTDNVSDTTLQNNEICYISGGTLDFDPPPLAKYLHIVNGTAYYANIKSGSNYYKNRIVQSNPDDPDSCPTDNYIDLLEEITGISSINDNPIVFTKKRALRLNGSFNELGQGQVTYEDITKTVGCVSNRSIVQTRFGLFWAGNDGFYWTDGFNFKKISDNLNIRYAQLVSDDTRAERIQGAFDSKNNRVYWAVQKDSATDNDYFFILDLRWGVNENSVFTTRSNGSSFSPTAITFYQGDLIQGDRRGYLFKHSDDYATDLKIDTNEATANWTTLAVTPTYISCALNFGIPMVRKWVSKLLLSMQNVTNVSVQISSANDDSGAFDNLKEIRYRSNILWGDFTATWGDAACRWSYFNLIEEMRRFPAGGLRCSFKQVKITQSFTNIYKSDDYGTATVSNSSNTATLSGAFAWPTDVVDYYITFETDGYDKEYLIQSRTSTTVTFVDPGNEAPTGTQKWLIRGVPKGEKFNILSYVVYFAPLTDQTYKTYRREQDPSGDNA